MLCQAAVRGGGRTLVQEYSGVDGWLMCWRERHASRLLAALLRLRSHLARSTNVADSLPAQHGTLSQLVRPHLPPANVTSTLTPITPHPVYNRHLQ